MKSMNRRLFLGCAATGAVVLTQWNHRAWAADAVKPIRLGLIGSGWYGLVDVEAAFKVGGVEVLAICDVDQEHLNQSAAKIEKLQGNRPRTFKDYRDLLQVAGLDAVIIATPPQWHALQLIAALDKGLDVYCEKPLAYDIRECRAMVDAVRRSGRIVQVGFQRRQSPAIQAVRDHVRSGAAGRIICAEANIHYTAGVKDSTPQPPPPSLDWEWWCGPAPLIPYSPQVGHFNWRLEKTTGQGHLVDWGIHLIDATRMILGESTPRAVSASGGLYHLAGKITTPDILAVQFDFETCPVTWRHRIWGAEEYTPEVSNGVFLYGEKQTVFVTDDRWVVIPRGKSQERTVHQVGADAGKLHMAEFLQAVRERRPAGCSIEEGYNSTATVKLAMISYDTGRKVVWDAAKEQVVGHPEGAKLLRREYRKPWKHPGKA